MAILRACNILQRLFLAAALCFFLNAESCPAFAQAQETPQSSPQEQAPPEPESAAPLAEEPETLWDTKSAAILSWYGIDEEADPSTTLSFDRFREQINLLIENEQPVLPLTDVAHAIASQRDLPPMAVALTFDGGRRSILKRAIPLLVEKGLPFTVFFASDLADRAAPGYLSWDDLRALQKMPGVTIGIHPSAYGRALTASRGEILRQINTARTRFREELSANEGRPPTLLAWPFGIYTKKDRDLVQEQGFDAALGQQSGIASPAADLFALPRFMMTEDYGDIDRFRTIARALPLPATSFAPEDPILSENPPAIGFTVAPELEPQLGTLSCFTSGLGRTKPQIVGKNRIELRFPAPFEPGRVRINCTMPSNTDDPDGVARWRWLGFLFTVPAPVNMSAPPTPALSEEQDGMLSPTDTGTETAFIPGPDGPL